ncbi:MAG: hypothetical protein Q9202_002524 [Teloschistes flavicans]
MDRYGRPLSPGGRRAAQPGRLSTGTLVYPSSFDPYYASTRSNRDFSTAAGPRTSAERVVQPRAVPRYRPESPPGRQARDDYIVRPRRLTLDPDAGESRRPMNFVGPSSPNRSSRPIITTSDRPSSPPSKPGRSRQDEPYYLQPAASTRREHRHNYTADSADASRIFAGDRDGRERTERGGYPSSGIGSGRSGYNMNQPLVRQSGDRDRGGYEYTDPREQMYRDTEPRPRPRRESYSGGGQERPLSMTGLEDYLPRIERTNRDAGPPVSTRGFGNLGRAGSLRQGPSSRDYDPAPSDFSRDDYERRKAHIPRVAVHQKPDDSYSYRDEESTYDDSRDRRPRKTAFEDEVVSTKPREVYNEDLDRQRRAKTIADTGKIDIRAKDRHPEDYDRTGEEKARRHHDKGHHRDDRDGDRDIRRKEDVEREGRVEASRDRREDPYKDRREELPRERRDDGYRERRDDVPREKRYHGDNGLIFGGAAAAAGLATEAARSHHQHKEARDDRDARRDPPRESDRDRLAARDPAESTSASTVSRESDEERRERRRRRRERREREDREARELEERQRRKASEPGLAVSQEAAIREPVSRESLPREPASREPERRRDIDELAPPRDNTIREQPSYERRSNEGRFDVAEPPKPQPRGRHHHSRSRDYESFSDSSSSSDDSLSRRPRNVRVVTPPSERALSQPPPQPKSILRAPREKFPEDPAPVREGVAPLKDAGKKGIPPNARWTKIDRKLVNPEALEAGNERYEERVDYVIVLRVLTKEEIEAYAAKTQELRAKRAETAQQVGAGGPPPPHPLPPSAAAPPQQGSNVKAGRPEASGLPEWG